MFFEIILPLIVLLAAMFLSIVCGKAPIDWQNLMSDTVFELRLVRVSGALVIGSSLALAGLVLQAVLRNVLILKSVSSEVPDMSKVVNRGAAGIKTDLIGIDRLKVLYFTRHGIEKTNFFSHLNYSSVTSLNL